MTTPRVVGAFTRLSAPTQRKFGAIVRSHAKTVAAKMLGISVAAVDRLYGGGIASRAIVAKIEQQLAEAVRA